MTSDQRFEETQRMRMGSGAFVGVMMSLVFLVVAAGFVILGALFISIPNPQIPLGVGMLLGAGLTGAGSLAGLAYSVRAIRNPFTTRP